MKGRLLAFCAVIAAAAAAVAADGPAYTFSMRVGNSQAEQSVSKGGGKKSKGGSTKTKTTERSLSWPVSVSVHGASRAEGALASAAAQAARSAAAAKVCGFVVIASIMPKNAAFLPPVNFPKFALENRGEFSL